MRGNFRSRCMALAIPCSLVPLLTTLLVTAPLHASRQDELCRFPSKWEGTWFQSGVRQPITIEHSRLSTKGRCVSSEGDKFIVVDEKGSYRCVVIHEKHANVLQYKETYGHPRESLPTLCSFITGDALLYSMFRIEATPVSCPFKGPFTFTYNRGHGDCKSPVSSIDSCTEESRLLLRYQACPDVYGTESTVEELQCLATWKEGSSRYLVGKLHHNHALSNEERYRCFVYEKSTIAAASNSNGDDIVNQADRDEEVDFRVAQSGDATCNGLFSPMEGSRTMTLKKAISPNKCKFPTWLTTYAHWHTLDYRRSYTFHHRNTTLRITNTTASSTNSHNSSPGYSRNLHNSHGPAVSMGLTGNFNGQEIRVECTDVKQSTADMAFIVTHFTMGCQSGFMCMMYYRRDGHVIEVQTGERTRRLEDACHSSHFNRSSTPFVTLVTSSPEPRQCPYLGKFTVTGVTKGNRLVRSANRRYKHDRKLLQNIYHRSRSERSVRSNLTFRNTRHLLRDPDAGIQGTLHKSHTKYQWTLDLNTDSSEDDISSKTDRSVKKLKSYRGIDIAESQTRNSRLSRDLEGLPNDPCSEESQDFTTLVVGCSTMDTMEFRSDCTSTDIVSAYSCHGRWEDNGTNYLITTPLSRSSHGARRYCFMYREMDGIVHFSSSSDSCKRNISPGVGGTLAFNVTSSGQCVETNGASSVWMKEKAAILIFLAATILSAASKGQVTR